MVIIVLSAGIVLGVCYHVAQGTQDKYMCTSQNDIYSQLQLKLPHCHQALTPGLIIHHLTPLLLGKVMLTAHILTECNIPFSTGDSPTQEPDIKVLSEAVFHITDSPLAQRAAQGKTCQRTNYVPGLSQCYLSRGDSRVVKGRAN